ncbi:hypothetical protein TWF281_001474 [Arthrobotrys megalospora]
MPNYNLQDRPRSLAETKEDPSPLLALPLDIFIPIYQYAGLRGQIALSLTTKRLRYLSPKKEDLSFGDSLCVSKIYRQLIPPRSISCVYADEELVHKIRASPEKHNCQFCLEPLCSPICSSALFLDVATGVFYPQSLYPVSRAKLLCYPDTTTNDRYFGSNWTFGESGTFKVGTRYSTIWCEHHRCPRDIFASPADQKSSRTGKAKEKTKHFFGKLKPGSSKSREHSLPFPPEEKLKFEQDLREALDYRRRPHELSKNWMGARFLVGDGTTPRLNSKETRPVYERFFYDILCRHCLHLHLKDQSRKQIVPTKSWTDNYISQHGCVCNWTGQLGTSMCGTCGISTVKFTSVEAFDPIVEIEKGEVTKRTYPLYLATDCRIELETGVRRQRKVKYLEREVNGNGIWKSLAWRDENIFEETEEHVPEPEVQRIVPRFPDMAKKHLEIVRGFQVRVLPPNRVGIDDLPYSVLKQILGYVLVEDGDGAADPERDVLATCLGASYVFFKAWHGKYAAWTAVEWMKQEVRDANKGYYF